MRNHYDQFTKGILGALLQPVAWVETGREIPGHVEIADLWIEPDAAHAQERERLGMLGRMLEVGACLIEAFSQAPRVREARSCILKQYALDHAQAREAARSEQEEPAFPRLWLISAGRPDTLIEAMELREMEGWPRGFWCAREFDACQLVVLRMLPRTPETLLLRLLGRGATRGQALLDLSQEPQYEWALRLLWPTLLAFRVDIYQNALEEEQDMDTLLQDINAMYARWEQETMDKGREAGREEGRVAGREEGREEGARAGLVKGIETVCAAPGIELSEQERHQMATWDVERLEAAIAEISASRRWPASSR